MKHRPRKSGDVLYGLSKIPISKSIARKAGMMLGVDTNAVINAHDNRFELEAIIAKLEPCQVLDLLIEIDLIVQQSDKTTQRSVESVQATNTKLNTALEENKNILKQLSKLVHEDVYSRQDESIDQLVPTVSALVKELKIQNHQLEIARKAAEEAAQSKMEFLANMSHEIRTPMNGIFGMISLVLDTPLNSVQKDYIETVQSSTESLLTILNDILEYSKLSSTVISLEAREFSPRNLLMEVVRTFELSAKNKGLRLIPTIYPDVPSTLIGDDHRIRQILSNFLGNAIKFTQQGQVRAKVSYKFNKGNKDCLMRFSISDTGIGMDSQTVNKLFQPFTQADASITRNYGGTGLGLSICRALANAMAGKIIVESGFGKGSTFHFEVPLQEPVQQNKALPAPCDSVSIPSISELADGQSFPHKPILIVEDNEINQKVTSTIIGKLGYPVTIANNGLEAVNLCNENNYSIIFMDLSMPEMDGFEATQKIRSKETGGSKATIIAVTGHSFLEYRNRCEEVGIDDFLTKPYNLFKLKEKLDLFSRDVIN